MVQSGSSLGSSEGWSGEMMQSTWTSGSQGSNFSMTDEGLIRRRANSEPLTTDLLTQCLQRVLVEYHQNEQAKLAVYARLEEMLTKTASRDAAEIVMEKSEKTILTFQADCEVQLENALEAKLALLVSMQANTT
ncbi:hypothetical protein FN846DRAFT_886464 [Sphaerosporella brunnea]|uniref:Uncharacterized protein n=1 Tax=Sphaerosporella brunnea TaxID=1250544 RepID=A0A5J5F9I1_9PEZI|nr:hypothetical protein FN846DRAFT_886464 [Sphaerosporella brunnea]